MPLALTDSTLLKAVLALAAQHDANRRYTFCQSLLTTTMGSNDSHKDVLHYKYQAIRELSLALNDVEIYRQDALAASIFLLIFLDLLESGSDKWNYHLEGAKNLIASTWPSAQSQNVHKDPGRTVEAIRTFVSSQLYVYVCSAYRLFSQHKPQLTC